MSENIIGLRRHIKVNPLMKINEKFKENYLKTQENLKNYLQVICFKILWIIRETYGLNR